MRHHLSGRRALPCEVEVLHSVDRGRPVSVGMHTIKSVKDRETVYISLQAFKGLKGLDLLGWEWHERKCPQVVMHAQHTQQINL